MFLSSRRLFTAILLIALVVMAVREISDPDFWWHLRTGQYIVETHAVPHADIFSSTNAGRPWTAHEWLSEVILYALFALGAFPALILAFAAIIGGALALVYARCDGKPYVAAFVTVFAAVVTAPTWGVRPQMLSLLLTSVFLYMLEKRRSALWVLVPLMVLWVNLHSGYALGLVIVAIYLGGEGVQRIFAPSLPDATAPQSLLARLAPLKALAVVLVLCFLVVPLNPNGATMYVYPFETLTSPSMQTYIQEWFSPDFHLLEFQPFALLLLATPAAIGLSGKRVTLTQATLLLLFGYASLRSARNIPLFAIIAAPILAEHLWAIVVERGWARVLAAGNRRPTALMACVNWALLAVIALAGIVRIGIVIGHQTTVERATYPAAAVDYLQAHPVQGTLYNSYGWGGYLIWRLYPATRVFIDGRADVYGDAFIEEFLKAYRGGTGWTEPLERYDVRVVLIEPDAPLAAQLEHTTGWKQVYADKQAVIFERN